MSRLNPATRLGPMGLAMLLAQSANLIRRHWGRLDTREQNEFRRLVQKSKGRPNNLSAGERTELQRLVRQLDLGVFGREMIAVLSPIRGRSRRGPFGR